MSKPAKKPRLRDPNVVAFDFIQRLTGEPPKTEEKPSRKRKSPVNKKPTK